MAELARYDTVVELNKVVAANSAGRAFAHRQTLMLIIQTLEQIGVSDLSDQLISALSEARHSTALLGDEDETSIYGHAAEEFGAIIEMIQDHKAD